MSRYTTAIALAAATGVGTALTLDAADRGAWGWVVLMGPATLCLLWQVVLLWEDDR